MLSAFQSLLRPRLSRRIVWAVFTSIVAIEAVILVPSVYRRERELRAYSRTLTKTAIAALTQDRPQPQAPQSLSAFIRRLQRLQPQSTIRGAMVYQLSNHPNLAQSLGAPVATYGEPFQLMPPSRGVLGSYDELDWRQWRYTVVVMPEPAVPVVWMVHYDATFILDELLGFMQRIVGLVMVISGVVTLVTLGVLRQLLINPIMTLREDLLRAAPAAMDLSVQPAFASLAAVQLRQDELGEVIETFGAMFAQIRATVAERQQVEAALRESEAMFRAVVEQASESLLIVRRDGRFADVNRWACEALGYSREELLQLSVMDVQQRFADQDFAEAWEALVQQERSTTIVGVHRRKDGSTYPSEARVGPLKLGGETFLLAMVRDVSDREQMEQAQVRLAELGELAAMIVHELRNPLATVILSLSSLGRMGLPEGAAVRLELAQEEAARLKRLLDEILLFAKDHPLQTQTLDLNDFVREILAQLGQHPLVSDRILKFQPHPRPLPIQADPDKLKQVLINLITNACEAVSGGMTVTCQLQPDPQAQSLELSVHNGGDPIPAALLPRLMRPFVSTKATGNGLGLAITKRLVEAHRGWLRIESSQTMGTTVRVGLPLDLGRYDFSDSP